MGSLKELRDRISSVKSTQKITKAMQMVAASKFRRAQEAAEAARPYALQMGQIFENIAANTDTEDMPLLMRGRGSDQVHLLVVATAERGLCGGFNSQIARRVRLHILRLLDQGKEVKILTVGKKGADALRREFSHLFLDHISLRHVKKLSYEEAELISKKIQDYFRESLFDVCSLFYSRFVSVISQEPTDKQLIPVPVTIGGSVSSTKKVGSSLGEDVITQRIYEYEPEAPTILEALCLRNLTTQIFNALLENAAGEMGARMSAMDNATRNAGDMINKLSISYNRQRQAKITTELIEIIAGAEAL